MPHDDDTDSTPLSEQELRPLIRIIGDLATVTGGVTVLRATFFDRLAELFGADCWVAMTHDTVIHGGPVALDTVLAAPAEEGESYLHLIQQSIVETHPPAQADESVHLVSGSRALSSIDSSGDVHVDNQLLYAVHRTTAKDDTSALLFFRRDGQAFSDTQRRVLEVASRHIPWCHDDSWQSNGQTLNPELTLPPRLLPTLQLLRTGHTRRQIAGRLFLSPHTIDGYVKDIFHHFDVQSRVELIHKTMAIYIDTDS